MGIVSVPADAYPHRNTLYDSRTAAWGSGGELYINGDGSITAKSKNTQSKIMRREKVT
jgi:hypothetical protein